MDVVAHDARSARLGPDGVAQRAHWEASARKGNAEAQALLDGPDYPEGLEYLHGWFLELSAARNEGMSGPAPITHQNIDAWARLTSRDPAPHEVQGILALDAAWRAGLREDSETAPEAAALAVPEVAAWPKSKTEAQ